MDGREREGEGENMYPYWLVGVVWTSVHRHIDQHITRD